jgi:protein-S-isoprenylcysteine O-methyltransferase Ste14
MQEKQGNKFHSWLFVFIQAIILFLLIFLSSDLGPNITRFVFLGGLLQVIGWIGIFISAFNIREVLTVEPLPKADGKLSTDGLYKYVRHPMYSSVLLLSLGIALVSGNVFKYLLVIALAILFYYKSNYEEHFLSRKYKNYSRYAKKTPKFFPNFRIK